jgi:putative tryptophan/tyrosine transport system substrate-binding protein
MEQQRVQSRNLLRSRHQMATVGAGGLPVDRAPRRRGDRMRRRDFTVGLVLAAVAVGTARAQPSTKRYRIAILDPATPVKVMSEATGPEYPLWGPLFTELRRLGYVEGQNLVVERYSGQGHYSPDLARAVVSSNPNLIFAEPNRVVRDLLALTDTIPIVGVVGDPVRTGIVTNLARPGGNFTGISVDAGPTVYGKRLELLREIVPSMTRVGFLATRYSWEGFFRAPVENAAKQLGISIVGPFLELPVTEAEFRPTIAAMSKGRANALFVSDVVEVFANAPLVIQLALEYRLPSIYGYRYFAKIGGLMAYDYGLSDLGRIAADQIDKVLNGMKPGDIPIYQAEKFTLSINLNTARALDITISDSLLAHADEVIE